MSKEQVTTIKELLEAILKRPIAYHRIFATVAGGALPGLFLSQFYYWSNRGRLPDGWFYKSREEWERETGMTRREQETARRKLVQRGLIEEQRKNLPCRLYFRLNAENFYVAVVEAAQQDSAKCTDKPDD